MKIFDEFREFAMRGNVIDLAIGVIMGVAFAPIVSTLVDNIIMPPIGYLLAGIDFSSLAVSLKPCLLAMDSHQLNSRKLQHPFR